MSIEKGHPHVLYITTHHHFPPDDSQIWLSASMILIYRQCPKRVENMFYEGLPYHPNELMVLGTLMHTIFDKFYDDIDMAYLLTMKVREEVQIYFRNILPNNNDKINEWLDTFSVIESMRWEIISKYDFPEQYFPPYRKELYLELKTLGLFGTIDRIDRSINGFVLLDYKGKPGSYMSDIRRQLWIYQTLVNYQKPQLVPGKIKEVGAYFYKTGDIYTDVLGYQTINAAIKAIHKTRNCIKKGLFPRNIQEHCFSCSYLYLCLEEEEFDEQFQERFG